MTAKRPEREKAFRSAGGVVFQQLTVAAAASGQGVALTDDALAAAELAEGRLVRLFSTEIGQLDTSR